MYAVIETGGKQYRVQEGDVLSVEKLGVEAGELVAFDKVLVLSDDNGIQVGTPYVDGAKVVGEVKENGKGQKVIIFKYEQEGLQKETGSQTAVFSGTDHKSHRRDEKGGEACGGRNIRTEGRGNRDSGS